MQFEDRDDGEYRIHAGSLELQAGQGFLAAVIVNRFCKDNILRHEVYRDTAVSGGHLWSTSDQALRRALLVGAGAVTAERHRTTPCPGRPNKPAIPAPCGSTRPCRP